MNTLDGTVISMCDDRHRHQEWLKFLRLIDDATPSGQQIHLIADNYSTRSIDGELRVLGSIVQNTRGAVGTFSGGSSLQHGFYKRYKYDDRLADPNIRPPFYTGFVRKTFAISQWWESYHIITFN